MITLSPPPTPPYPATYKLCYLITLHSKKPSSLLSTLHALEWDYIPQHSTLVQYAVYQPTPPKNVKAAIWQQAAYRYAQQWHSLCLSVLWCCWAGIYIFYWPTKRRSSIMRCGTLTLTGWALTLTSDLRWLTSGLTIFMDGQMLCNNGTTLIEIGNAHTVWIKLEVVTFCTTASAYIH